MPNGTNEIDPQQLRNAEFLRLTRRQLERWQTAQDPSAIDEIWHQIASPDRWLRHSARVALENQPVTWWRQRALDEATPLGSMNALIALARKGEPTDQSAILRSLERQPLEEYDLETLLGSLRVYAISFVRQGRPEQETCERIAERLGKLYPHADPRVNRDLSELLVYLNHPEALTKTLALLATSTTQEEQIHFALTLTHFKGKWSGTQRIQFLEWLQSARRFPGGKLVKETVQNIKLQFVTAMDEAEKAQHRGLLEQLASPLEETSATIGLPVVKRWTLKELTAELDNIPSSPDREAGERALAKASCLKCHLVGEKGGRVGPDLSQVGARFDLRAILESVVEPSKVIDEKYRQTSYVLDSGKVVTGRPIGVSAKQVVVETDPIAETSVTVSRHEIEEAVVSRVSPMPTGLIDVLTREEILSLVAYLKYRQ